MSNQHEQVEQGTSEIAGARGRGGRRRFIKAAGAAAIAVPVMESLTGHDILTMSAKAQTAGAQGFDGPLTGTIIGAA
jgi:hypothetical protein